MVELKNASVTYSNGVRALEDVSLTVNDGEFAFVVGESGAGKSTLIKLLLREVESDLPEQGQKPSVVKVNGFDLNKLRPKEIPMLRRTIGFVFQDFKLIDNINVKENIAFVLRCVDAPEKYIRKRIYTIFGLLGMSEDKLKCYPHELSGGEQQRVAIARALVNDPQLIIADEPTGNLDPHTSLEIVRLLKDINKRGNTTVLMVTHEHSLVQKVGGRVINIRQGKVDFDGVI